MAVKSLNLTDPENFRATEKRIIFAFSTTTRTSPGFLATVEKL
jgi:hypothetical protein